MNSPYPLLTHKPLTYHTSWPTRLTQNPPNLCFHPPHSILMLMYMSIYASGSCHSASTDNFFKIRKWSESPDLQDSLTHFKLTHILLQNSQSFPYLMILNFKKMEANLFVVVASLQNYSWHVCVLPDTENIGCGEDTLFPYPWFTRFVRTERDQTTFLYILIFNPLLRQTLHSTFRLLTFKVNSVTSKWEELPSKLLLGLGESTNIMNKIIIAIYISYFVISVLKITRETLEVRYGKRKQ